MSWTSWFTAVRTGTVGVPVTVELGGVVEFPLRKRYALATTRMMANAKARGSLEPTTTPRLFDTP